ncbi:MAG TPA: hypothetical protein VKV32_18460 [Stellaceae bacterium]|nr:hypothetical protein [Stellaceae bacterium]
MSEAPSAQSIPASYQILFRASGEADFKRAGAARLAAEPVRGATIEVDCDGRKLRGIVDAIFIPPGCDENCVGTVFLSES